MISFLGVRTDGQTDTVLESSYGNMSAHKKFQLKAQNKESSVDRYMPPRRTGMHNDGNTFSSDSWNPKNLMDFHSLSSDNIFQVSN